jgi:hypothetical protein
MNFLERFPQKSLMSRERVAQINVDRWTDTMKVTGNSSITHTHTYLKPDITFKTPNKSTIINGSWHLEYVIRWKSEEER